MQKNRKIFWAVSEKTALPTNQPTNHPTNYYQQHRPYRTSLTPVQQWYPKILLEILALRCEKFWNFYCIFYERWEVSVPCLHSSKAAFALVYMLIIYMLLVNKVIHKFTNSIQFFKNGNKEATLFFKTQNILLFSVVFCPVIHNIYSRKYCLLTLPSFFIGTASARSYKIGVVGNNWLVGWLVTQFSQKRL